jgi:hypothetical protein
MIKIAITQAAFDAIAKTLPVGSVGYEAEPDAQGEMHIWIDDRQADKLAAMRKRRPASASRADERSGSHCPV